MRYNTKHKIHLDALHALEKGHAYIIECKKEDLLDMMGLARRKSLLTDGKMFSCTSYTCIPTSMVQEHIYILKYLRKV